MAVTFSYGGWSEMRNIEIRRISSHQEPGGGVAARSGTLSVIEGTGIVPMTADTNATTGVRRRIDDIRRILSTPGQRLLIQIDGVTVVDHSSRDYSTVGSPTFDLGYGPVIDAQVTELSGARCALVSWRAEYRHWADVNLHPIIGFVCTLHYEYDRTGYVTITRRGVLTVRRSAPFPIRDGASSEVGTFPSVITFIPPLATPFGGDQGISKVPAGLGNNPDFYRRFVAGPIFNGFIRESQSFYVDESLQKLFFNVVDRQVAMAYPASISEANVQFGYELNLAGGQSAVTKSFSAELYGRPDIDTSELVLIAVAMSKNRINWSSAEGPNGSADVITRLSIRELDMLNRKGISFEVTALSANMNFGFTTTAGGDPFKDILEGVHLPTGPNRATPDAYGLLGLVTMTDFVYEAAPLQPRASPNTVGLSMMAKTAPQPVVAQGVPITAVPGMMMAAMGNTQTLLPPGDATPEVSEAPLGYFRVQGSMHVEIDNRIAVASASPMSAPDREYQFGKPAVVMHEEVAAIRCNLRPDQNIAYAAIPWPHVVQHVSWRVSPVEIDANGNRWYSGLFRRTSRVLYENAPPWGTAPLPGLASGVVFQPPNNEVFVGGNPQVLEPDVFKVARVPAAGLATP